MATTRSDYLLSQLDVLEAEGIHIIREVAAEFERPVLLFSGGKDSIVMLRLAEKAFAPGPIPFPVMHVDTGHNFPEVLSFRDRRVEQLGVQLIVASVPEALSRGLVREAVRGTIRPDEASVRDAGAAEGDSARDSRGCPPGPCSKVPWHRRSDSDQPARSAHGKRLDRDRAEPRGSAPPTPPCVRVRTRRFERLG